MGDKKNPSGVKPEVQTKNKAENTDRTEEKPYDKTQETEAR